MTKALPLDEMSMEEKLQTMETIWDDLVSHAESVPSPEWHKEVLSERDEGINQGTEEIVDWNAAKNKIKNEIK
jgi:hypothetical protein